MALTDCCVSPTAFEQNGITEKERAAMRRMHYARSAKVNRFYHWTLKRINKEVASGCLRNVNFENMVGFDVGFTCCLPRQHLLEWEQLIANNCQKVVTMGGVDFYYTGTEFTGDSPIYLSIRCNTIKRCLVEINTHRNYNKFLVKRFNAEVDYGVGRNCYP